MQGQTRAFVLSAEELETRRNPDELFVTRRKLFGGALKPGFIYTTANNMLCFRIASVQFSGVGKPLRAKPAGPTLVKYYPETKVR